MMRVVGPSPIRHRRGVSGLICLSSGINHTAMWLGTSPNVNTCIHQHGKLGNQYGGKEIAVAIAPMADTARMPSFAESRM